MCKHLLSDLRARHGQEGGDSRRRRFGTAPGSLPGPSSDPLIPDLTSDPSDPLIPDLTSDPSSPFSSARYQVVEVDLGREHLELLSGLARAESAVLDRIVRLTGRPCSWSGEKLIAPLWGVAGSDLTDPSAPEALMVTLQRRLAGPRASSTARHLEPSAAEGEKDAAGAVADGTFHAADVPRSASRSDLGSAHPGSDVGSVAESIAVDDAAFPPQPLIKGLLQLCTALAAVRRTAAFLSDVGIRVAFLYLNHMLEKIPRWGWSFRASETWPRIYHVQWRKVESLYMQEQT